MKQLDDFYLNQKEPNRSCLLALRDMILSQDSNITSALKYGMPFFCYRGKMFCYLWFHKKHQRPYIGLVEGKLLDHPDLLIEKRSRMKIMLFDACNDLPKEVIEGVLKQAIDLYSTGKIKIED